MPREIVNPSSIHPPAGYSHIVSPRNAPRVRRGSGGARPGLLSSAGATSPRRRGRRWQNLRHALDELGAGWDDVVKATVYTTRPTEYETIGAAMAEAMGGAAPPAQVLLGVTGLALPELLIEIELVVSLP